MKLTKGKKGALVCFAGFLAFMAVCTVVAKGIYAAGLPRVSTSKPYNGSITHIVETNATVKQGQEYGVYVETGLRVDTVSVGKGDLFQAGDALFRIETGDLNEMIAQRRLEIGKLETERAQALKNDSYVRSQQQTGVTRAREDYDQVVRDADIRIAKCEQELAAAQRELALYDQYLKDLTEAAEKADTQDPDDGKDMETEQGSIITDSIASINELSESIPSLQDYEQDYTRQEKRLRLEQAAAACRIALEEAKRQKETDILAAARAIEDAETADSNDVSAAGQLSLDMEYQEEKLKRLLALAESDGWVYAEASGRVVDCSLAAGERIPDGACILYALDSGERIINAVFSREQSKLVSVGTQFEIKATMPDGSRITGTALLENQEEGADGNSYARLSFEGLELEIGQSVQLSYRLQTEPYALCISRMSLYQEAENDYYIFVAEEREGILGAEWKVKKTRVNVLDQNDTVAAVQSAEISSETRVVAGTTQPLADGMTVRVVQ